MNRSLAIILLFSIFNLINTNNGIKKINKKLEKHFSLEDFLDKNEYVEQSDDLYIEDIGMKRIGPKYFCRNKKNEGQYEHRDDCHKYWHCLYVGTIFEIALERKCPIGTMFHPSEKHCEISTQITCTKWRKSIYGESYKEPELNKITNEFLNNYYLHELQNQYTDKYYQSLKKGKKLKPKVKPYFPPPIEQLNKTKAHTTTVTTTTKSTQLSSLVLLERLRDLLETNKTITTAPKNETNKSLEINFSPLDKLLIEKIGFLKSNKLNKTQMDKHLSLIKHIFEFKNNSINEIEEFISENSNIKQLDSNKDNSKIKTSSTTSKQKTTSNITKSSITTLPKDRKSINWKLLGFENPNKQTPQHKDSKLIGRLRAAEMAKFSLHKNSMSSNFSSLNLLHLLNILVLFCKTYV